MGDDLFAIPTGRPKPPRTANAAPETSHRAAAKVDPVVRSVRDQVIDFAKRAGEQGFTDGQIVALGDDWFEGDRTYRPRRTELTDENIILDSGRRVENERGNPVVVWVHRDFCPDAPPIREAGESREPKRAAKPKSEGREMAVQLGQFAKQMKAEGRTWFADELERAADLMARLST